MSYAQTASSRKSLSVGAAVAWIAITLLGCWACFHWASTLLRISQLYVAIPLEDYWRVAAHVTDIRSFDFRYLWQQHNEHRIIFPDIVFALDVLLLHGQKFLPITISFLCYLGSWAVLAWQLLQVPGISRIARFTGTALTAVLLGWKGSAPVLADAFLLQWTLTAFAALASLTFAAFVPKQRTAWPMAAMVGTATVATYSSANGLLLWLVLITAAYLLAFTKRQVIAVVVSATIADGLYFVGYRFTGDAHVLKLLQHPVQTICFVAAYLSMPFGGMKSPQFGVFVGLLNVGFVAVFLLVALRDGLLRKRFGIFVFGYYAFSILTALLIAAGRMEDRDATFAAAKAARYLAPVMITWGVFLAMAVWILGTRRRGATWVAVLTGVLVILLAISFVKLKWWLIATASPFTGEEISELSIENKVQDPRLLRSIFPDPSFVEHYLPVLKADHLSIFYEDKSKWLGETVSQIGPMLPSVEGAVTRIFPVISGFEVTGWAGSGAKFPYGQVFLSDQRGQIIGFGQHTVDGLPSELLSPGMPSRLAWVAFVAGDRAGQEFFVYLANQRGVSPLRTSHKFPFITAVRAKDIGAALPDVSWRVSGSWSVGGAGPHEQNGPSPSGTSYGSWNGSDKNRGEIVSSAFPVPANDCLVLPVLHGPATKNLSVFVLDNKTQKLIGTTPMLDADVQWEFWRVPTPSTTETVQIIAKDEGEGFGAWLAVATPTRCR